MTKRKVAMMMRGKISTSCAPTTTRAFIAKIVCCLILMSDLTLANKCPPPENIMPCRCRGRNDQVQVWCSHSDLERVNGALENLMRLRSMPAIDELIVENNKMPTLPARAFGALQIGRLLLRNNGLESLSRNAFAGLEDSLEEIYIVEDKLVDFPFDAIEKLRNLEAFTIEKSKIRLLPRFNGLNRLKHIRIDGSLIAGFPVGAFASMSSIKQIHVVNSEVERLAEGIFGRLDSLLLANFSGNRIDHIQRRCFALLPRLEVLALGNNKLSEAPSVGRSMEELISLKSLDISNNGFTELPEGSFVNLRSLQLLNLAGNQISRVHTRSFTHLPALRKVDLSENLLRNFPRLFFDTTPLLEELRMRKNMLGTAGSLLEMLSSLRSLRYLDLSANGLSSLPSGSIKDHSHLTTLDLSDNRISRISPSAFANVPSLQEMSLKNNSLSTLDPSWGEIPSLKELDLSLNALSNLDPSTLGGLLRLQRLDLSHNSLRILGPTPFASNKDIEFVDLSSNGLQALNSDSMSGLSKLNKLDLSRNHLESLQAGSFRDLKNLQALNLGNNRINSLPGNLLSELRLLEDLNFRSNSISYIPSGFFQNLALLKELNLKHNNLGEINSQIFSGLGNLEMLRLSSNQIARFDDGAFDNLMKLRGIDLSSNRLSKLSGRSFKNLPQLERFEARENRIGSVETGILANSEGLQIIDLAHNGLTSIPEVIKEQANLKVVDLSHNQIEGVDVNAFSKLGGLMELYLNDNKIKGLKGGTFENLSSLTIVDLDGNDIESIPSGAFKNLQRLIYLRMSRNSIKRIERAAFSNLNSLDGLDLQENYIGEISPGGFEKTGALKYLNLSHNNLDSMQRMGLLSLGSLEVLDFSFNKLSDVDADSLRHLIWLVELRMNDNGICGIPSGTFDGMSRLKMLVLRNNRLKHLYESVFYKLRNNIAFLDVSGNPLECDCEMTWLRNLMAREELQELSESVCDSPPDLKGTLVKQARPGRMICTGSKLGYSTSHHLQSNEISEPCPPLAQSKRRPRPASVEPEDRPLFGGTEASEPSSQDDQRFYGDPGQNELKLNNRRKDEKLLLESNDYVAGDTPTIYAGSSIASSTKATQQDVSKKSQNGNSVLSSLFGIPIDFGFNFGISPSFSWSDTKGDLNRRPSSGQTSSRNSVLSSPKQDPLPPSWIERPSRGHPQSGNVYEAPEYIPRKPSQPYIPLNDHNSSNNPPVLPSGSIVDIHKTKAPSKTSSGIKFPDETSTSTSNSNSKPKASWHPDYNYDLPKATETGFIPIEPFFHNKNQQQHSNKQKPKEGATGGSKNYLNDPARQGLGSSSTSTEKSSSSFPITSPPNFNQILSDPKKITSFVPSTSTERDSDQDRPTAAAGGNLESEEYSEEDHRHSLVPIEIQTTEKPKEESYSNFWDIFSNSPTTTGKQDSGKSNGKSNNGHSVVNDEEEITRRPHNNEEESSSSSSYEEEGGIPFNFSAPIDNPVGLKNSNIANNNNGEKGSSEEDEAEYNIPFGEPYNPNKANSNDKNNKFHVTGKPTITKIIETELPYNNNNNHADSDPKQEEVIAIPPELSPNVGNYIQDSNPNGNSNTDSNNDGPSRYEEIPTEEEEIHVHNNDNPHHHQKGPLVPPVIIGNNNAEPRDWYYTNYQKSGGGGGGGSGSKELLERLLERSRANQLQEDLVILSNNGVGAMLREAPSSLSSYRYFLTSLLCYFLIIR